MKLLLLCVLCVVGAGAIVAAIAWLMLQMLMAVDDAFHSVNDTRTPIRGESENEQDKIRYAAADRAP